MTRSLAHFGEDDEAASTLKNLGYSNEEIGRSLDFMPSGASDEDRIRLALRSLSQEHSENVQRDHAQNLPKPKNPPKAQVPPTSEEYEQGRRDEAALHDRRNQPQPGKPRAPRQPKSKSDLQKMQKAANYLNKLSRLANGKRR